LQGSRETYCSGMHDPLELSTTVRSSGFVSDSMLCDAYAKQAANKDAEATTKAANKDEGKKR
jgi:hypothetical protein